MKKLILLILFSGLILGLQAQETEELSKAEIRKLQKEQRKAEKKAEEEQKVELTKLMVEYQRFVLEADQLSNKRGVRIQVSSNINFIIVDSTSATLQLGSAYSAGYNGVGGTTIDGTISRYEVTSVGKDKSSYSISMVFNSSLGTYDISLMVSATGKADANIGGTWPGKINYHGELVPLALSRIYKGNSSF